MENQQKHPVEAFSQRKPRGPVRGDMLQYHTADGGIATFEVVASVVWDAGRDQHEVGLVWGGGCTTCGTPFWQTTPIRATTLVETCSKHGAGVSATLDAVGIRAAFEAVQGDMPQRHAAANIKFGLRRRGRIEEHMVAVLKTYEGEDGLPIEELIARGVASLPEPEEGQRDTRRQRVVRAIQQLAKEKDGPIIVSGKMVILVQ